MRRYTLTVAADSTVPHVAGAVAAFGADLSAGPDSRTYNFTVQGTNGTDTVYLATAVRLFGHTGAEWIVFEVRSSIALTIQR